MKQYELSRFVKAQAQAYAGYETALREMRAGSKASHWIWYIFPQLKALGLSEMAVYYGIADLEEARAYMQHPSLSVNLREISEALLGLDTNDPLKVMSASVDVKKLRSSMTLFAEAAPECDVFQKVLDKYFEGKKDHATLRILGRS